MRQPTTRESLQPIEMVNKIKTSLRVFSGSGISSHVKFTISTPKRFQTDFYSNRYTPCFMFSNILSTSSQGRISSHSKHYLSISLKAGEVGVIRGVGMATSGLAQQSSPNSVSRSTPGLSGLSAHLSKPWALNYSRMELMTRSESI